MAQPQEENSALTGAALGTTTMKLGGDWFLWTMFYLPLISSKEQRGDLMSGFSYSCVDGISHCGTTEAGEPPESSRPGLREGNNPILGDCSPRSSQWVWDFIRFITGVLPSSAPKISHGRFLLVLMDRNPLLLGINAFLLYFYIILYILVSAEIRESWNGLGWERLLKARFLFFFCTKVGHKSISCKSSVWGHFPCCWKFPYQAFMMWFWGEKGKYWLFPAPAFAGFLFKNAGLNYSK